MEMNTSDCLDLVSQIAFLEPGMVLIEGGEPLLRPDLPLILQEFHDLSVDVCVITNGQNINSKWAKTLVSFVQGVIFSLDASDRQTYSKIKRGGDLEALIRSVNLCIDAGLKCGATAVISRENSPDVEDIIRRGESLGLSTITLIPLKPFRNMEYYYRYALTPEEQADVMRRVNAVRTDMSVFYDEPFYVPFTGRLCDGWSPITKLEASGCIVGKQIYIMSDGRVGYCMFEPPEMAVGSTKEQDLTALWERMSSADEIIMFRQRSARSGRCASCTYFHECYGCHARITYLRAEDDPVCPMNL